MDQTHNVILQRTVTSPLVMVAKPSDGKWKDCNGNVIFIVCVNAFAHVHVHPRLQYEDPDKASNIA